MENIIQIKNFSKSFGRKEVVHNISFEVNKGEIFAFLGANGSGKTTTLRSLLSIYSDFQGELLINGEKFTTDQSSILGYLPEERGLYLNMTPVETLVYFGELKGISKKESEKRANEFLDKVGLGDKKKLPVKKLSSGQQQKIQLGITIIHEPSILILDEPTKGLDPINRRLLMDILDEMNKKGATILFSTHILDEAERIADKIFILKDGAEGAYGTIKELKKEHSKNMAQFISSSNVKDSEMYKILEKENDTYKIEIRNGYSDQEVLKHLVNNYSVTRFEDLEPSLEEIFIKIMQNE